MQKAVQVTTGMADLYKYDIFEFLKCKCRIFLFMRLSKYNLIDPNKTLLSFQTSFL